MWESWAVPLAVCALEIPSLRILAANQALASLAAAGNPAEIVGVTLSEEVQRGVLSDLLPPLREAAAAGGNLPPREVHAQLGVRAAISWSSATRWAFTLVRWWRS